MPSKKKKEPDILDLAMKHIADNGWSGFHLTGLASQTGLSLETIMATLPARRKILRLLGRHIDSQMLAIETDELFAMSVRDRLFELVMRRLDAALPYRDGIRVLADDRTARRELAVSALCQMEHTTGLIFEVAGIRYAGLKALAAKKFLQTALMRVFKVWLNDETADRSQTMAALDKELSRLEHLATMRSPFFFRSPAREENSEAAA